MAGAGNGEQFSADREEAIGHVRVVLHGELDLATVEVLRAELAELAWRHRTVVLDLSELGFIDSTGLELLLAMKQDAERGGWRFSIRSHCSPPVRRAMELTALDGLLLDHADDR